jgi:hypothetical protein
MTDDLDPAAEGRRAGRELWPAGASWVPEPLLARLAAANAARTAAERAASDAAGVERDPDAAVIARRRRRSLERRAEERRAHPDGH